MPYIEYEPEIIDSKLGLEKENYPMVIQPLTTLRGLSIHFQLNVIFRTKEVTSPLKSEKYYIGIRNAIIELHADDGECADATKDILYGVSYNVDSTRSAEVKEKNSLEIQLSTKAIQPKFGIESEVSEIEARKNSGTFSKNEKILSTKCINNWVQWTYSLPSNNSLFSDVLDEILTLEVSCTWNRIPLKGKIRLKPGQLEVFDSERKKFPRFKGLAFLKILYYKRLLVHAENIQINYKVC